MGASGCDIKLKWLTFTSVHLNATVKVGAVARTFVVNLTSLECPELAGGLSPVPVLGGPGVWWVLNASRIRGTD